MNSLQQLCSSLMKISLKSSAVNFRKQGICKFSGLFNPTFPWRGITHQSNPCCPLLVQYKTSSTSLSNGFSQTLPTRSYTDQSLLTLQSVSSVLVPRRDFRYFSFKDGLSRYLRRFIDKGPPKKRVKKTSATDGRPMLKGIVLKTIIKKPKKPNSANRKCVRVKLSTGREATAYVPGIGHNLQEHHTVLVRAGRVQDLPGVKLKCIRGKFDLAHVKKAT